MAEKSLLKPKTWYFWFGWYCISWCLV